MSGALMDIGSRDIYKLTVRGLRMREVPPTKGLGKIMQDTRLEDAGIADRLSQSALHRRTMVDCQIRTFDVTDQPLLARMLEVPREPFLPGELAPHAVAASCSRAPHPSGRRGIDRHGARCRGRNWLFVGNLRRSRGACRGARIGAIPI